MLIKSIIFMNIYYNLNIFKKKTLQIDTLTIFFDKLTVLLAYKEHSNACIQLHANCIVERRKRIDRFHLYSTLVLVR